jgi:hypothetical protein
MKNNTIQIGDTVYLFETDPKCETIYEVQEVTRTGAIKLFHPIKGKLEVYPKNVKPSIH